MPEAAVNSTHACGRPDCAVGLAVNDVSAAATRAFVNLADHVHPKTRSRSRSACPTLCPIDHPLRIMICWSADDAIDAPLIVPLKTQHVVGLTEPILNRGGAV